MDSEKKESYDVGPLRETPPFAPYKYSNYPPT
jgi:hypothetical protein